MLNLVICDDNHASICRTEEILKEYFAGKKEEVSIDSFLTAQELYEHLQKEPANVVLMDIVLAGEENGIEAARRVKELSPACEIAFLTNYLSFATEVFAAEPCCFILKSELSKRLDGLIGAIEKRREKYYAKRLLLSGKGVKNFIPYDTILYIEHVGRNAKIVCKDREYMGRNSMDDLERQLGGCPFVRCHKGFIVNWYGVKDWKKNVIYMENGAEINVSRSCRDKVCESLSQWNQWRK